jgi:hypothetical protein
VVRASTLEAGGLAPEHMDGLREFAERAMLVQNPPRVHEATGQQTLCALRHSRRPRMLPRCGFVSAPMNAADAVATARPPPCLGNRRAA